MARPANFSTKDRILGAAEELFAQHGFAATSLRQVTGLAAVNIAAVNYHFGSKENLVNEVFRRRMDEMTARRLQQLETAQREHPGELEPVLAACLPGIDKDSLYWRLDFLAGALTYAMSDFGMIKRPSGASEAAHRARAARELIRFAAAGLQAPLK